MPNQSTIYSLQVNQNISAELAKVVTSTQALARDSAALARALQGNLDTGTQSAGRLEKALTGLHTQAERTGSVFKDVLGANVVSAGLGKLTGGLLDVGKASLTLVGNLESNTSALEAFTGSSAAAQQQLADFATLASKTSFNQQDVVRYAVQLEGVGVAGSKVVPTLRSIADALAGVGRGADPQKLQQVSDAYIKVLTQGRAQADELLSFAEAGIPIYDLLARALGKNTAEITKMAEAGQLTADVFTRAFDTGVQQRWQGAAERSSQTLQGIISNAQDVGDQFLTILGKAAVESSGLEGRLGAVVNYLNDPGARGAVEHLGAELGAAAGYAFDLAGSLGKLLGLPPLDIPPPPDFSQAATNATQLAAAVGSTSLGLQSGEAYAGQLSHDIEAAHNRATQLSRAMALADQQSAANITRMRDALQAQDRLYDDQLSKLRQQADQVDRAYRTRQQERSLARAQQRLADDQLLGLDIFSSAGLAARGRVEDDAQAVQDAQDQIREDNKKAEIQAATDRVQAQKQAYDRGQQDAITAAERTAAAVHAASQKQIDDFNATADALKKLQDIYAGKNLDPAITAATNEYAAMYSHKIPEAAQTGIAVMTTDYLEFLGTTLPTQAAAARPSLFANLLGTPEQQQQAGTDFGHNLLTGLTAELFGGGGSSQASGGIAGAIGAKFWAELTGDKAGIAAADRALGGAYGAAGDDARAAINRGINDITRQTPLSVIDVGDMRGVPMVRTGLGPNDTRPANPPPGETWQTGHYDNSAGAWVWIKNNPQYYGGGRANGGPVLPGGVYPVGEYGPETLYMGAGGGYVVPSGAGSGGPVRVEVTVKHLCPVCLRTEVEQTIDADGQRISQSLAHYERGRLA